MVWLIGRGVVRLRLAEIGSEWRNGKLDAVDAIRKRLGKKKLHFIRQRVG